MWLFGILDPIADAMGLDPIGPGGHLYASTGKARIHFHIWSTVLVVGGVALGTVAGAHAIIKGLSDDKD